MSANGLQDKREILRGKKLNLLRVILLSLIPLVFITACEVWLTFQLPSLNYLANLYAAPMLVWTFWASPKMCAAKKEVDLLKRQVEASALANRRNEIIARIYSGQIKPNLHLQ